jgi:hypothetical protein
MSKKESGISLGAMRAMGAALERLGLANKMGLSFNGARDIYDVFGYKKNLDWQDFWLKYLRQDIAKRVIDFPADSTWVQGAKLNGGEDNDFNTKWADLEEKLKIWPVFTQADKLAGLGQYSVIFIGYNKGSSEMPVPKGDSDLQVLYLQTYAEPQAKIVEWERNTTSPRFGLPVMYELHTQDPTQLGITPTTPISSSPMQSSPASGSTVIRVHYSRIVHVVEGNLTNTVYGLPRMLAVYNRLDDLDKVCGGSAEMYWLAGNRGLQVDVDKEMDLDPQDAKDLSDEIKEYQHNLRRIIRTRGVKINPLGSETPDPRGTFNVLIAMISASTGIPQRVLLGAEAGQLASTQDRANWADRVTERRKNFAGPNVLRAFIMSLQENGILPPLKKLEVTWPPAFVLNPLEQAQMFAQKARSIANLSSQTMPGKMPILTQEECRVLIDFPATPDSGMGTLLPPQINPDTTTSQTELSDGEPDQTPGELAADEGQQPEGGNDAEN